MYVDFLGMLIGGEGAEEVEKQLAEVTAVNR
jgi:hypothetical protein